MDQLPLIQISDLHIGEVLVHNSFGFISGHHEHDIQLCQGLSLGYEDARKRYRLKGNETLYTLVSGDVSAAGREAEFAVAHTYLRGRFRRYRAGYGQHTGLQVSDSDIAVIPGNHDHWGGAARKRPYNGTLFPTHFRHCPWRIVWPSTGGGFTLEVFGVDSNSGLFSRTRSWLAQGSISSNALNALEGALSAPSTSQLPVVRAITVHHSLSYTHGKLPGVVAPTVLDSASRDRLLALAAQYGVGAILTGHTHDAFFHEFQVSVKGQTLPVWELRCATTLQGPASKTGAGFLAHKIHLDPSGKRVWSVWRYGWKGSTFKLLDAKPAVQFYTP